MALHVSFLSAMSHDPRIPLGCLSLGQLARTFDISPGISIFMGQAYTHRVHNEQIHAQSEVSSSSSNPKDAIRRNFLGSIPSMPVAGHPEAHSPQVRQRFKLPPSGSISITFSLNMLFFFFGTMIGSSGMIDLLF
jgi:hypothetical protein